MPYKPRPYGYALSNDPGASLARIRGMTYYTSHGLPPKELFRKQKAHRLKMMRRMQRHYITPRIYPGLNKVPDTLKR